MMQSALPFNIESPRARLADPQTSVDAGDIAGSLARAHYLAISAALAMHSAGGTIYEIAEWAHLDHFQVARRLPECASLFAVVLDGEGKPVMKKLPSGRQGRVWRKA